MFGYMKSFKCLIVLRVVGSIYRQIQESYFTRMKTGIRVSDTCEYVAADLKDNAVKLNMEIRHPLLKLKRSLYLKGPSQCRFKGKNLKYQEGLAINLKHIKSNLLNVQ